MGDILNTPDCSSAASTFNIGIPLCDLIKGKPLGIIFADAGKEFTPEQRATKAALFTALDDASRAARGARVYPLWRVNHFEDLTKEPTRGQAGNLDNVDRKLLDGIPSFKFHQNSGELLQKQLEAAEGQNMTFFLVDDNYALYGTKSGNNMAGFSLTEIDTEASKFGSSTEFSKYPFTLTLASMTEYKSNSCFVKMDSTITGLRGLNNVDLNTLGAPPVQAVNVIKITPVSTGGKNIGILYPSLLADVDAWEAINDQTDAAHAITSVAWDAANGRFNVTLDSTAYAALTVGHTVSVNLTTAAALYALGINGFESIGVVVVTKA